jgi:hypothetical protein
MPCHAAGIIGKRRILATLIPWHRPRIQSWHCAAILGTVRALHIRCAERLVSLQSTVPPAPGLPPRRAPRKGMGAPWKGVRLLTGRMTGVTP